MTPCLSAVGTQEIRKEEGFSRSDTTPNRRALSDEAREIVLALIYDTGRLEREQTPFLSSATPVERSDDAGGEGNYPKRNKRSVRCSEPTWPSDLKNRRSGLRSRSNRLVIFFFAPPQQSAAREQREGAVFLHPRNRHPPQRHAVVCARAGRRIPETSEHKATRAPEPI